MSVKDLGKTLCDEKNFERIYNKYVNELHDFLYYKYGAQINPKDITQEAFIKLWGYCKKVNVGKARSFLFTVANNMVLNDIKHQKVVLKYGQNKKQEQTNETPQFVLEEKQFLEHYKSVLESLSEEQRVAFMLNKVEGKKHSEIADILGISQKAVEYRIYSAFNILRNELEGFKIK
ncbi:RNA polymerase sigma factor [Aestuariivivens insulae]|uniref:RNA polymerase sigma factor n=1 Tax=Aestuariivivens insulae TaxID=1621988 RepID=UPI001F5AC068|nr:RNA polymerase sigma factor [Aestuariivivens insulae]